MDPADLLQSYRRHINSPYADFLERQGLASTIQSAVGAELIDAEGKSYIDFIAGYGIFNLGHNPPELLADLHRELDAQPLWNRPFLNERLVQLCQELTAIFPGVLDKAFVCSTGAEAIDTAIKLARLSTGRRRIVAAQGAFHGFTLGALSLCGIPAHRKSLEPLLPEIDFVPFGDAEALAQALDAETAAVFLEPIQAEIGAIDPPVGYLKRVREICNRTGTLLVLDQVRTGMGRTGTLFACMDERVVPDVLVIGKSLAGGIVPIGAVLARSDLWGRFGLSFPMSASSFAGNRLACTAALAALRLVTAPGFLDHANRISELLWRELKKFCQPFPEHNIRLSGKGLLIGLHLPDPRMAARIVQLCIDRGLLMATAFCDSRAILIEPPLVLSREQAEKGLTIIKKAMKSV
ncbi:aspartate aminotransferase family protein [candidate division KSB1 bacterium]|nr:aspartate aminotransferase family protein [candidate division KSB1 bacterium]